MLEQDINRIEKILTDLSEITRLLTGKRLANIPKHLSPEIEKIDVLPSHEQIILAELFDELMQILADGEIKNTSENMNKVVDKFKQTSLNPHMIGKDKFQFTITDVIYEIAIERKYLVYFYIYKLGKLQDEIHVVSSRHFALLIRLLGFFEDILKVASEYTDSFKNFVQRLKKIGDDFLERNWQDDDQPKSGDSMKSKFLQKLYFFNNEGKKIPDNIAFEQLGDDFKKSIRDGDIAEIMDKISNLVNKDKFNLNVNIPDKLQNILVNGDEEDLVSLFQDPELLKNFSGFSAEYFLKEKLRSYEKELHEIQNRNKEHKLKEHSRYNLIKDFLVKSQRDKFIVALQEATGDDKNKLLQFLREQTDDFISKRILLIDEALELGFLPIDDDLLLKKIMLNFINSDQLLNVLDIDDPELKKEIKTELLNKQDILMQEAEQDIPIDDQYKEFSEKIAKNLWDINKDKIAKLATMDISDEEYASEVMHTLLPEILKSVAKDEVIEELGLK